MAAKIRVLTVISGLAMGGAERFAIELACSLDRTIFEPVVCALWQRRDPAELYWAQRLTEAGITVLFATDGARRDGPRRYLQGLRYLARHFRHAPVDIAHSHLPLAGLMILLTKRALGAKAIMRTAHAGKEWGDGPLAYLCRQLFTKWVFPLTFDVEACVSRPMMEAFNQRPGARLRGRKSLLLNNAIHLEHFQTHTDPQRVRAERVKLGWQPSERIIGSVGRLSKEKGYDILIEAAALVRAQMPQVKFVVVGHGAQWEPLQQQIARLGLQETFFLAGMHTDVTPFYALMDLFVLPSVWEGLPTVILESMASGVPVVATEIPGTRELITHGHTGWLVAPNNAASLAEGLLTALQSPAACERVARTAQQEVAPCFALDRVAKQYERLYLELLGR